MYAVKDTATGQRYDCADLNETKIAVDYILAGSTLSDTEEEEVDHIFLRLTNGESWVHSPLLDIAVVQG
jgi:hypothetical protein